jgi:hypothetical protein
MNAKTDTTVSSDNTVSANGSLSLRRETVRVLRVRSGVQTGGLATCQKTKLGPNTCPASRISCQVSCQGSLINVGD